MNLKPKTYELIMSLEDYAHHVAEMKEQALAVFREHGDFTKHSKNPEKAKETMEAIKNGTVTQFMMEIALSTSRLTKYFLTPKTRPFDEDAKEFFRITTILSIDEVCGEMMWHLSMSQLVNQTVVAVSDEIAKEFAEAFFGKNYQTMDFALGTNVRHYFSKKDNSHES